MNSLIRSIVACACLLSAACSQQALLNKFTPHPESEIAQSILDQVRRGELEPVKAQIADELRQTPDIDAKLQEVTAYFPAGTPKSVKLVGAQTSSGPNGSQCNLTYEYEFADAWAIGNVQLQRTGDSVRVTGIHVYRLAQPLEVTNAFTLRGKDLVHWLVALLGIAIPAFCIFTFVLCLRTPIARRKWLWALCTLLGVMTVRFNWTSGAFDFQLLSVQLFGASAFGDFYGPMMVGLSLPLGAIWFLACREGLMTNARSNAAPIPDAQENA